jgi:hypothetical protein
MVLFIFAAILSFIGIIFVGWSIKEIIEFSLPSNECIRDIDDCKLFTNRFFIGLYFLAIAGSLFFEITLIYRFLIGGLATIAIIFYFFLWNWEIKLFKSKTP